MGRTHTQAAHRGAPVKGTASRQRSWPCRAALDRCAASSRACGVLGSGLGTGRERKVNTMVFYVCWMLDAALDAVAVYLVEAEDALEATIIATDKADADGVAYEWGEWPELATQADLAGEHDNVPYSSPDGPPFELAR